ncbi:MAG: hypothetical protein ACO4AL_11675 [Steroidobacteraceae bacterium]
MTAYEAERGKSDALEPSVSERLRLGQAINTIEKANEQELRTLAKQMAHLVFMVHPATVRYLVKEAAEGWDPRREMRLSSGKPADDAAG